MISSEIVYEIFNAAMMFLWGALLGSFGNVIILRLPQSQSIVKPRSRCPKCEKQILARDNIPILSYLILKGRCRFCSEKISWRYPLVEALCGVLFALAYLKLGYSFTLIEVVLFFWAGVVVSFIDLDHRILPDVFTLSGIVIGLVGAALSPERSFWNAFWGVLAGGGFLWAVAFVYYAIRKEEGMGGGDIKLLAWIGAVLGWKAVVFSILVSSLSGSAVGLFLAARLKSTGQGAGLKTAIPFGPFLVLAAILYVFIGDYVMQGYLSIFFPFAGL